jgi:hypothetical protein
VAPAARFAPDQAARAAVVPVEAGQTERTGRTGRTAQTSAFRQIILPDLLIVAPRGLTRDRPWILVASPGRPACRARASIATAPTAAIRLPPGRLAPLPRRAGATTSRARWLNRPIAITTLTGGPRPVKKAAGEWQENYW